MAIVPPEKFHSISKGQYIGDFVYGSNDGIVTTFAVVSGAAGAFISPGIIIILGLANLIADGISMGVSSYLSAKSRLDFQFKQRSIEENEVETKPEKEKDEVRAILRYWGIDEDKIEPVLASIIKDKKKWVNLMMRDELGIMEETVEKPVNHALATSISFVIAGSLPLTPYLFGVNPTNQFGVSIIATAISLFVVGSMRTYVTGANWIISGIQMLLIGGVAAGAAYFVGAAVKIIFNINI